MSKRITIVDYGVGNLRSIIRAFEHQGAHCTISGDPNVIRQSECIVLPGQGAFSEAVSHLTQKQLVEPVLDHIKQDKLFFGICLGFQILFESSEEKGQHKGLGVFKGTVKRFPDMVGDVPHVGWNAISVHHDHLGLFQSLQDPYVYFTHSYYVDTPEHDHICTSTHYGFDFPSSVQKGNLFACQFHPEKSGDVGQSLIKTFLTRDPLPRQALGSRSTDV